MKSPSAICAKMPRSTVCLLLRDMKMPSFSPNKMVNAGLSLSPETCWWVTH